MATAPSQIQQVKFKVGDTSPIVTGKQIGRAHV